MNILIIDVEEIDGMVFIFYCRRGRDTNAKVCTSVSSQEFREALDECDYITSNDIMSYNWITNQLRNHNMPSDKPWYFSRR